MKISEMRALSLDDLKKELINSLKEAFNLRMQKYTGQLSKTHVLSLVRKRIAHIKTVMHQKQGGAE